MTTIRPVTATDSNDWRRVRQALWPDGTAAQHQRDIDRYLSGDRREPAQVFLAFDANSQVVGFAELSIRNIVDSCNTHCVAYLEGWYVAAEFRRKGVGRALIQAAEKWAISQGCSEFGSDSEIDNHIAHAAHLRSGFEETGRVRTYRKKLAADDQNGI